MGDNSNYNFDSFDDGETQRNARETQQKKSKDFLEQYSSQLQEIESALNETLSTIWDQASDPVALHVRPYEQSSLLDLIKTDNKLFNKVTTVFSVLCVEIRQLSSLAESKFYPPLALFGENFPKTTDDLPDGDAQLEMGKLIEIFIDLSNFVNRVYLVARNLVHQLASLYHPQQKLYTTSFKSIHLQVAWESLGELFRVLITLDELILNNSSIAIAWNMYKSMMKTIKLDTARYGITNDDQLKQLEKLVLSIEGQLLEGLIFQNCMEQDFDFPGLVDVRTNKIFQNEFLENIRVWFNYLSSKICGVSEVDQRTHLVGLFGLYCFYMYLFRDPSDKKLFKAIWEIHKKLPIVHLYGNAVWFPTDFLLKRIDSFAKLAPANEVDPWRGDYLRKSDKGMSADVGALYLQVSVWMVRMESDVGRRTDQNYLMNHRLHFLLEGVILAHRVTNLLKTAMYMHSRLKIPMKREQLPLMMQCFELLKAIRGTFHRRSAVIAENLSFMIKQVCSNVAKIFQPLENSLKSLGKISDAQLDVLSAVTLALQMLSGTGTYERRVILRVAVNVAQQLNNLKEPEWEEVSKSLRKLDLICNLQDKINRACDTSFLYWSRDLVPQFLASIYKNPNDAPKLHYIVAALQDPYPILSASMLESYKKEIHESLFSEIVRPLCRDIENDLRLHIHVHLHVSNRNPFSEKISDYSKFLKLRPLRFFNLSIDLAAHVANYLDTQFYNLNTVALNDWKTYEEMRNLALQKYGLRLTEVHLPGATIDSSLDILEIMRNIHIFVSKYHYNLNNQIFVEATTATNAKHLNVINIRHIANSIRTHGTGIINTTVNFTYQFLKQKFVIFSQFLFDDHIKARLMKDNHWFKTNKEEQKNMYPYDRAEKFNREIRKLGVTDGLTYLDQFRKLITEIGNAMGYVRMVRAGGQNHTSNAIRFVPDLNKLKSFEESAKQDGLTEDTIIAGKNLDDVVKNLLDNFGDGTRYFYLLVQVFKDALRSEANSHLKNFAVIIPPLTINFIDHILQCKERMTKKTKEDAAFSDDGFAIGLAFILRLLDQNHQFDSLHWFDSVGKYFASELARIEALTKMKKDEEAQTLLLSQKRLRYCQLEFELLYFAYSGARIFFKDADEDGPAGSLFPTQAQQQQSQQPAGGDANAAASVGPAPPPSASTDNFGGGGAVSNAPPPPPPPMSSTASVAGGDDDDWNTGPSSGPPPPPPPPPPPF